MSLTEPKHLKGSESCLGQSCLYKNNVNDKYLPGQSNFPITEHFVGMFLFPIPTHLKKPSSKNINNKL
jgi:hypothetical protein